MTSTASRACLISFFFLISVIILMENCESKNDAPKIILNKKLFPVKKTKWHRSRRSFNQTKFWKQDLHQLTSFVTEKFCKMEDQIEKVSKLLSAMILQLGKFGVCSGNEENKIDKNIVEEVVEKNNNGKNVKCLRLPNELSVAEETKDEEVMEIFVRSGQECPMIIYKGVPNGDCSSIAGKTSGIYRMKTNFTEKAIPLYCEMHGEENGWIVIQRRSIYSNLSFDRGWKSYRNGFGLLCQDFWIGNYFINQLTTNVNFSLMVELTDKNGRKQRATYKEFTVSSQADGFRLAVNYFSGDALDGMTYHNGSAFSTADQSFDLHDLGCAVLEHGGWWYNHNSYVNYTKCSHRFLGSNLHAPFSPNFEVKEDLIEFCGVNNTNFKEKIKFGNSVYWRGKGDYVAVEMKIKLRDKH